MSNIISNKFTRVIPAPLYHIGDIAFIAYNTIPDGWMECNGSAISRTTFVELFNKIGTTYGAGDESTTFNLPDLRGEFIRGWDHGRGVDSGRALGSEQFDAFQGHWHTTYQEAGVPPTNVPTVSNSLFGANNKGVNNQVIRDPITNTVNGTPRTASETRPRNVALVPIIKVKNIAGSDAEVIGANADTVDGLHASDFALMLAGNNTSPIGTVILTAANTPDPGWLECDGSAISRIIYPDLFNKIGTTYGVGDGSSTFNLPDLRGEFVRGWDHGKGTDSGRVIGSGQLDALQNITGQIITSGNTFAGAFYDTGVNKEGATLSGSDSVAGFDASLVARTSSETRPRNVALMYVIKAKNIASVDPTVSDGNAKTLAGYYPKDFMLATDAIGYPFNNYLKEVGPGDYGAHFSFTGSDLIVSPFEASINKLRNFMGTPHTITLPPRKAAYVYAQDAGESTTVPIVGHYDAKYPDPDQYTVGQWIFNTTGAIANNAVGNGLAVANNMAPAGTVTLVDGWADYGMQGDGTSGYYVSTNSTGFPTAAQERELGIVYTSWSLTGYQDIAIYGTNSNNFFYIVLIGTRLYCGYNGTTNGDTGFDLEIGKTYFISYCYDGSVTKVFVNGSLIYTASGLTLTTGNSTLYIFKSNTNNVAYCNGIIHYLELRNKVRTPQQIAAISNKLCLPCHYTGYSASYPANDTTTGAHIYKFDDASGNTVTDENGTLNGTATGTTIVNSEIGLGKERRFIPASAEYVTLGSFAFNSEFTVVGVITVADFSAAWRPFFGNSAAYLSIATDGTIGFTCGTSVYSIGKAPLNVPSFVAVTVKNGFVSFYLNSAFPDNIVSSSLTSLTTSSTAYIGRAGAGPNYFSGKIDYVSYIPRALTQAEIAQYYKALMLQKDRTLIDDCLPSNSISLGFVRTGSSALIGYNDTDYKYMRNEGATKTEGNKRVFLGWKYFSGVVNLSWQNPFGTRKIKTYYKWAQDAYGTNESDIISAYYGVGGSTGFGVDVYSTSATNIIAHTISGGLVFFNNSWQTSGYIGCYAEVL